MQTYDIVHFALQDYFQTAQEYQKLEKVVFGGSKGQVLSGMVVDIFNEFSELMNKFTNSTYDPLSESSDVRGCNLMFECFVRVYICWPLGFYRKISGCRMVTEVYEMHGQIVCHC